MNISDVSLTEPIVVGPYATVCSTTSASFITFDVSPRRSPLSVLRDPREDDAHLLKEIEARRENRVAGLHG